MVSRAHETQCESWAPFASKENEWNRGLTVNFVPWLIIYVLVISSF